MTVSDIFLDNNIGTLDRAFCECDYQFITSVSSNTATNQNYDSNKCIVNVRQGSGKMSCCKAQNDLFHSFNTISDDCCDGMVVPFGSC